MSDPLDEVEGKKGMRDMAIMTRAYYDGLREQGFSQGDALTLTGQMVEAVMGRQSSEGES